MTDFLAWVTSVQAADALRGGHLRADQRYELVALTHDGVIPIVAGPNLSSLSWYPPDRLALGPVTYGGMVVDRSDRHTRMVCANTAGHVRVWSTSPDGKRWVLPEPGEHDAVGLLWRLMDPRATRPGFAELMGRLLLWGWLERPEVSGGGGPVTNVQVALGVRDFALADLAGLAHRLGVDLAPAVTAERFEPVASQIGHPSFGWSDGPPDVDTVGRLDYLHACIPYRWSLAHDLRKRFQRPDLAELVLAAPSP